MRLRSCLFITLLLICSCASIDNYEKDVQEKKFSSIQTEIKKIITESDLNSEQEKIKNDQKLNIELIGVNINDAVKLIFGTVLNVPYFVNDDVYSSDQKIDLVIKQKTSHNQLKNIFETALNEAGLNVLYENGCYYISRAKDQGNGKIDVKKNVKKVYSIYQLENIKPESLKNRISDLIKDEMTDLKIFADPGSDLIFYSVNEKYARRVRDVIKKTDIKEKQVYLEIKVIEVIKEGGLENGLAGYLSAVFKSLSIAYNPVASAVGGIHNFTVIRNPEKFNAVLGVLQSSNMIYKVAQPQLLIKSGSEGFLSIGDKIPILGSTIISNGETKQDVIYKSTGFDLTIRPFVIGSKIHINMSIEISAGEVNKLSTINSPSISSRSIKSDLICNNSEAVLIGGIYQDKSLFTRKGLPIENRIFNEYINYNNREKSNIELLFYIRPVII